VTRAGVLGRLAVLAGGRRPPGVYALGSPGALPGTLVAALRNRGVAAWHLDTSGAHTKAALLERCATDLALPAWFGRNWDALADALRDLPVPAAGGVVVWTGARSLDADVRATALEIVRERTLEAPALSVVVDAVEVDDPL
jgi:Barstar (barnase inhibitor)